MDRRAFLGALCAAPVAVPAVTKSLAKDAGESAFAQFVVSCDPLVSGSSWAVWLDVKGYAVGQSRDGRLTITADKFRVVHPGEGPIPAFKVVGDQIVSNPMFPWGQFFGG